VRAALALVLCAACGGTKLETRPIGDTGLVIDIPSTWTLKPLPADVAPMKGHELEGQTGTSRIVLDVMTRAEADKTQRRATYQYAGHQTVATGGDIWIFNVRAPGQEDGGPSGRALHAVVPFGDGGLVVDCEQTVIEGEISDEALKICSSVRRAAPHP